MICYPKMYQQLAFLEAQRYVKRDVEDSGSEAQALHRSTEVAARLGVVLVEQVRIIRPSGFAETSDSAQAYVLCWLGGCVVRFSLRCT